MYYTGGGSYYTGQSGDLEQAQVPGLALLDPATIGLTAASILVPGIASIFAKKPKEDKGPTKAQLEAMRQQAEREQKERYVKYGLIGAGVLFTGFVLYKTFKKGKK